MVRCGKLCQSCGTECNKKGDVAYVVACPVCEEVGCDACGGEGTFEVDCPRKFVGSLWHHIGLAAMCSDGRLPVAGGVLDQSAWFMSLHQRLASETNAIQAEELKHGG